MKKEDIPQELGWRTGQTVLVMSLAGHTDTLRNGYVLAGRKLFAAEIP
jgi:hypothetical protein